MTETSPVREGWTGLRTQLQPFLEAPLRPPVRRLASPEIRLFLTSASLLFVELLLIRWIPANVIYIGFFSNFVLMASFLGIGAGILYGRDPRRIAVSPFAPFLLAVVLLVSRAQFNVHVSSTDEIFFGLSESSAADANFLVLPLVVFLVTIVMAGLAVPLGGLLTSMAPLRAYAVDIVGSLAGIALFALMSATSTHPIAWFVVVAALISLGGLGAGLTRASAVSALAMIGVLGLVAGSVGNGELWSPYYRIGLRQSNGVEAIDVNGIPHQALWPASLPGREPFYDQVYRWFPDRRFGRVLIVGAGSGTDTAVALAHGAGHVDAVEIDPTIQAIGVRDHPDHPYDDPRVARIVDDGRGFLRRTSDRYDLILFALPDSLTLVSTSANIRLESFLFTEESFRSVQAHLAPGGLFVLYNYYRQDWLPQKLAAMLDTAFDQPPLVRLYPELGLHAATLMDGPGVAALDGSPPPGDRLDAIGAADGSLRQATDDWPFLYLRSPTIEPYYLVALGLVLLWAVLLVGYGARLSGTPIRKASPHFFVLGVAFLLLETRSLVTFGLLFGGTWLVNALAFFAILLGVLLAIAINARFRLRDQRPLYLGLFAALAVGYLLPPTSLLVDPPWLRYLLASAIAFAPVFFANLIFTRSFRDTRTADMAFASNLLGAMVGGAIEYVALITGYQALLIVVGGLYVLAWLLAGPVRLLADRELGERTGPAAEPVAAAG